MVSFVVLSIVEFFCSCRISALFPLEFSFVVDRRIVDLIFSHLSSVIVVICRPLHFALVAYPPLFRLWSSRVF